jgi:hypothetical protein
MYIYLIKYNGEVIAAAQEDASATAVINRYIKLNHIKDTSLFEKESIRYFEESGGTQSGTEDKEDA